MDMRGVGELNFPATRPPIDLFDRTRGITSDRDR